LIHHPATEFYLPTAETTSYETSLPQEGIGLIDMATPTAMKHVASQQGRTPSQLAVATPPVSTPFSNPAHAVFSPRGPRSSPQQFKKSPASTLMAAQASNAPLNFDSPSTAAAMGALGIGTGLDIGLDNVGVGLGNLGALAEDDKLKRLETIIEVLNVCGLVAPNAFLC
jgi:hypothetical protein